MKQVSNPYILTALGCIGGLLFGFDIASMSAIIPTENYKVFFGDTPVTTLSNGYLASAGLTSNLQGGVTASMPGGSFVGAVASGWIADKVGRRQAIMISSIIFIVGSILTCASNGIAMLVVGRFICGECASKVVPLNVYLDTSPSSLSLLQETLLVSHLLKCQSTCPRLPLQTFVVDWLAVSNGQSLGVS